MKVSVIMGSDSDLAVMKGAIQVLEAESIRYEIQIVSAHRTPQKLYEYAMNAEHNGIGVIIAGAGGAAHLPGMVASLTVVPVIGVPINASKLDGYDALLSIMQMPAGVPVGTVSINGSAEAGQLAARIIKNNNRMQ